MSERGEAMNRKQRRECGVKGPVKTYTLTDAQIGKMKEEAAQKAAKRAFIAMLGLPLIALMDEFGFGKKRLERFMEKLLGEYRCFDEGYITLEEIAAVVKEETGVEILSERAD